MTMLKRLGRLFVLKTRTEVWLVIYAIAVGAVERGRHYLEIYPGWSGWMLALACTGVVFLAGAKLLDSVKPEPARVRFGPHRPPARRTDAAVSRNRPRARPTARGSAERRVLRKD